MGDTVWRFTSSELARESPLLLFLWHGDLSRFLPIPFFRRRDRLGGKVGNRRDDANPCPGTGLGGAAAGRVLDEEVLKNRSEQSRFRADAWRAACGGVGAVRTRASLSIWQLAEGGRDATK